MEKTVSVTEKMKEAGARIASDLVTATVVASMAGLGGCKSWKEFEQSHDGQNMDLIMRYVAHEIDAVTAIYIAMDRERRFVVEKTLHNSDIAEVRKNVPDVKVVGNVDMFQLLCKASSQSEGWMKSTKAMEVSEGCIVQVTTQQRNEDGSYAVAEALTFVPGVSVANDTNGGRKLVGWNQTGSN